MLKIKDNVNLEELEKFGFEITVKKKQLLYVWKNKHLVDVIEINTQTRGITNLVDRCGNVVLYDLIEAGYVEKVEE